MELKEFMEYIDVVTVGFCLCVGYMLKKYCPKIHNRYIPLYMVLLGIVVNCLSHNNISAEVILGGMISGLASTGMHETLKNTICGPK